MGDWRWLCVGLWTVLFSSTPGQILFLDNIKRVINDLAGSSGRSTAPEKAQYVAWCPIAEHPKRAYRPRSGRFCYATYTVHLGWAEAVDFCSVKGGALARLSGDEWPLDIYKGFFRQMDSPLSMKCAWVGLSEQNGQWTWLDGSPMRQEFPSHESFTWWWSCGSVCQVSYQIFYYWYKLSRRQCNTDMNFFCEYEFPPNETADGFTEATTHSVSNLPDLAALKQPQRSPHAALKQQSNSSQAVLEPYPVGTTPYARDPINTGATTPGSGPTTLNVFLRNDEKHMDKRRRRQTRSEIRRTVIIRKISTGTFLTGKPLFSKRVYGVSVCARHCAKPCKFFNFNLTTRQCSGFISFDNNLHTESRKDWEVWEA